ncbi:MAG: hypothetical protein QM749_04800 [Aquabacterium sp.]
MSSKAYVSGLFWDWSVTLPDRRAVKAKPPAMGALSRASESAGVGGLVGGAVGGIATAVAVVATVLLVPSLSLSTAGPLVGAVAGFAAAGCGLIGAMIGWGGADEALRVDEKAARLESSGKRQGAEHIYR